MLRFDESENVSRSQADILVNTVNTVGVMGAGVAKAIKERYPDVMPPYQEACRTRKLYPGGIQVLRMTDGRFVVNLASKKHFKDASEPEWVGFGLLNLSRLLSLSQMSGVKSVCLPPPGAGLGGLMPEMVQRMIRVYMDPHVRRGVDVFVSAPEQVIQETPVRYTGVGSRDTPQDVMNLMTDVSRGLSERGWILRSGNARGADTAFERGSPIALTESYLPWEKDSVPHGIVAITEEHSRLFRSTYRSPSGGAWSPGMKRESTLLMTRNGNQVFGPDFVSPSDVLICWTPHGDPVGGTRQAIALAKLIDIPIINLGDKAWSGVTPQDVISAAVERVEERRHRMGLRTTPQNPASRITGVDL